MSLSAPIYGQSWDQFFEHFPDLDLPIVKRWIEEDLIVGVVVDCHDGYRVKPNQEVQFGPFLFILNESCQRGSEAVFLADMVTLFRKKIKARQWANLPSNPKQNL